MQLIEFEQKLKRSYDKAKDLYSDLEFIKNQYRGNIDVSCMLTHYHNMRTMTILPIFKKMTLTLEKTKTISNNGTPTGYAADIENTNQQEITDNNEQTLENTTIQEEHEEQQGYAGDSLEAAAEYKRKAEEEAKKKAEQLTKQSQQNTSTQTNQIWILPVNGKITSYYGWRIHPTLGTKKFHDGIDIGVKQNTPVKAVAEGKVIKAEWYNGYGKYIEIDHGNNIISFYGHLNEYKVSKGQLVKQGQVIALSGNTAGIGSNGKVMTTGEHLHFGVHINKDKANPLDFMRNF